jgi:hypothetical protein
MILNELYPQNTSNFLPNDDYFMLGFYFDVAGWGGALIEHLRSKNKLILHDIDFCRGCQSSDIERVANRFVTIVEEFKSSYKKLYVNNSKYSNFFRSYREVAHIDFDKDTDPVVLNHHLTSGYLSVANEDLKNILIEDYKILGQPDASSHRIFAASIAAKKPKEFFFLDLPYEQKDCWYKENYRYQ